MIRAISWLFLLYFILLMIERTQSIIRVMTSKNKFFQNGFSGYVNTLTLVSIIGTVILLAGMSLFLTFAQNAGTLCLRKKGKKLRFIAQKKAVGMLND